MGGLFGGGGGGTGPELNKDAFDLSGAVKKYGGLTDEQVAAAKQRQDFSNTANQALVGQLQAQSNGSAPSLANAQLKQNMDRNLSQSMATAASQRGGNPALAARQVLEQQAGQGQQLAQQGTINGLQERNQAQQLLGNQLTAAQGQADNQANSNIQQGFNQEDQSKHLMGNYESQRFAADTARQNAIHSQQGNILGSVLGAAGTIAGGAFGGPIGSSLGGVLGSKLGGMFSGGGGDTPGQGQAATSTGGGQKASPQMFSKGGMVSMADGGQVDGKAEVAGDSPENDKVPAMLSPGEVVVPRSVTSAGPDASTAFVQAILKSHKAGHAAGYAAVVAAKRRG